MNATTERLFVAELAEALLASLQPDDRPPFDESRRDVIQRRSLEPRSGQVTPISWAEVKQQAREQAGADEENHSRRSEGGR